MSVIEPNSIEWGRNAPMTDKPTLTPEREAEIREAIATKTLLPREPDDTGFRFDWRDRSLEYAKELQSALDSTRAELAALKAKMRPRQSDFVCASAVFNSMSIALSEWSRKQNDWTMNAETFEEASSIVTAHVAARVEEEVEKYREVLSELISWVDNWDCPFKDQDESGEWEQFEPRVRVLLKGGDDGADPDAATMAQVHGMLR